MKIKASFEGPLNNYWEQRIGIIEIIEKYSVLIEYFDSVRNPMKNYFIDKMQTIVLVIRHFYCVGVVFPAFKNTNLLTIRDVA